MKQATLRSVNRQEDISEGCCFHGVVDAWLRADITLRASVIWERLAAEHGFTHSYQRVKVYVAGARPRIAAELDAQDENPLRGLHRRFEVLPGAQAQVDWGEEGSVRAHAGTAKVYSFHMVLSYSRDPFCCYADSMDLGTFFDCHRRAFAHFGGVPGSLVYDRAKTVVRRHVTPGRAVPLHPEAAAFAGHYGFAIDVLAARRPTGKRRVERQVDIVRAHVLAGRSFGCLAEMDAAFAAWLPIRRGQVHRTHGQVIAERAVADRVALTPLPSIPYLVAGQHIRRVGKDCLVSFEASLYSVPAVMIRAGQYMQLVAGDRRHAGALREETAAVLAPLGLRLAEDKTRVVHIDEGFDFLSFTIRRMRKRGTSKHYVYTVPSRTAIQAIKDKVAAKTYRSTRLLSPEVLIQSINRALAGWANYFRRGVSKAVFNAIDHHAWHRIMRWLRQKYKGRTKPGMTAIRRRFCAPGTWIFAVNGIRFTGASAVPVTRYRYRGSNIPTPWTPQPAAAG